MVMSSGDRAQPLQTGQSLIIRTQVFHQCRPHTINVECARLLHGFQIRPVSGPVKKNLEYRQIETGPMVCCPTRGEPVLRDGASQYTVESQNTRPLFGRINTIAFAYASCMRNVERITIGFKYTQAGHDRR